MVTEYHQKKEDHIAPITLEVEYFSDQEIKDHLEALVWSCRKLVLVDNAIENASSSQGGDNPKISEKDYERIEREAEHAWSALEAAFCHQNTFSRNMLSVSDDDAVERVVAQLVRWSKDIEWPEGGSDGKWRSTADTADECCEKTSVFMRDRLWPFTKIIR